MPDRELSDTVEFDPWGDSLSAFTVRQRPVDDPAEPRTGGRVFARAAVRVRELTYYARFQLRMLVTTGRFLSPDDPIPYLLTEKALAYLDAMDGS